MTNCIRPNDFKPNGIKPSDHLSFTYPSALNAGAKRSGATCHMAMPRCCYLAKGAKRPSHTTNTIKFDRSPFDPCNSIKRFDLCPFNQKNSTYLQPPQYDSINHCPKSVMSILLKAALLRRFSQSPNGA